MNKCDKLLADNMDKPSAYLISEARTHVAAMGRTLRLSKFLIKTLKEVDRIAAVRGNDAAYRYIFDLAYKNDKVMIFLMDVWW